MSRMDHDQAKALLSDFLEDELDAVRTAALGEHLDGCEACRAELESLRETMRSLSGLHRIDAPDEFVSKVERTIRRRSRGRFFGPESLLARLPFEWISFAIILALLAVYLWTVLDQQVRPADVGTTSKPDVQAVGDAGADPGADADAGGAGRR